MRLRSRCTVTGSDHSAGKSVARARMRALLWSVGERRGAGGGVVVVVLGSLQGAQRLVPVCFQGSGD